MLLKELHLQEEYFTGYTDLVGSFYRPCLSEAVEYDRSVGYFRSSVFILIGPDIINFVKRGGKIRLVSSPYLTEDDIDAINTGYKNKFDSACSAISRDIDFLLSNPSVTKNTEALATLISLGAMDVKLAFLPEAQGDYHAKLGIFYDEFNNAVSFKGSINETWAGWFERGNHETLDVFCSWREGRDERQVGRDQRYFEKLWNGQVGDLEVIPFPKVGMDKLKTIARSSLDDINSGDTIDFFNVGCQQAGGKIKEEPPSQETRKPLKHQLKAIAEWKKQDKWGILEHATGSGKTFTAVTALKEHLEPEGIAVVLVPDKLLHRQWAKELIEEIDGVSLLKAGDGHNRWKKNRTLSDFTSPLQGLGKRVVLVTMQTARTDTFINLLDQGEHIMLVADEVHEIGSRENSKVLSIDSGSRLGLSATPRRYGDPEGTTKILSYFGAIIQPPYTLEDAINDKRLVPYEYFPRVVRLDAEETQQWAEETDKIAKEFARSKRDKEGDVQLSSYLQNLIIQRSRIAKKANSKIPLALEIIRENYQEGECWLIYCEDQFQLGQVMESLESKGFPPLEYHTNMEGDSTASLEYFKNFEGILCSIKCLDQGVDIPKISHAIILASSQNPRQFIQRRGRVLRTYKDKSKAVIFDAIVMPVSLEHEPEQLSLLKGELQRGIQFAKTALNRSAEIELAGLAIELGIDPEEVGLMDSNGIEEDENSNA